MYWEEDEQNKQPKSSKIIVDISFKFNDNGTAIAADHAYDLFQAVLKKFPEIEKIDNLAIHSLYGAESGAGWERPETEIYLSKRTRFSIRLPIDHAQDFYKLDGQTLVIGNYKMNLSKPTTKGLISTDTLFCRTVVVDHNKSEDEFLNDVSSSLKAMGINVKKMLCGKEHTVKTPSKTLIGKTLLITDLEKQDSIKLQELGIGIGKLYGCGIFLPHKSIAPVAVTKE